MCPFGGKEHCEFDNITFKIMYGSEKYVYER